MKNDFSIVLTIKVRRKIKKWRCPLNFLIRICWLDSVKQRRKGREASLSWFARVRRSFVGTNGIGVGSNGDRGCHQIGDHEVTRSDPGVFVSIGSCARNVQKATIRFLIYVGFLI